MRVIVPDRPGYGKPRDNKHLSILRSHFLILRVDMSALLVGTTGSGKTTLVRQLLGTDPETERFPSTSTGKTTIADTEFILDDGPYRAAVTFRGRDEVRDYLEECMTAAALAAYHGEGNTEVVRRLLNH